SPPHRHRGRPGWNTALYIRGNAPKAKSPLLPQARQPQRPAALCGAILRAWITREGGPAKLRAGSLETSGGGRATAGRFNHTRDKQHEHAANDFIGKCELWPLKPVVQASKSTGFRGLIVDIEGPADCVRGAGLPRQARVYAVLRRVRPGCGRVVSFV